MPCHHSLLLVHWPGVAKRSPSDKGNAAARRSTWVGMQRLVEEGKVRSIGVSNYTAAHLDSLCEWEGCTIRPAGEWCAAERPCFIIGLVA